MQDFFCDMFIDFLQELLLHTRMAHEHVECPRKGLRRGIASSNHKVEDDIAELIIVQRFSLGISGVHEARQQIAVFLFTVCDFAATFLSDFTRKRVDDAQVVVHARFPRHQELLNTFGHWPDRVHETLEGVFLSFIEGGSKRDFVLATQCIQLNTKAQSNIKQSLVSVSGSVRSIADLQDKRVQGEFEHDIVEVDDFIALRSRIPDLFVHVIDFLDKDT